MGFYVIVPRKARHDSTGNPISSFKPAIAPLDCEFVFGGGRFLLTGRAVFAYRPDVDRERWMANKRTDVLVFGVLDKTAGNNI